MLLCQRRAQRGDRPRHPVLEQSDDIHVALDQEQARELAVGALVLIQAIKHAPLLKDLALRRVQVLGLHTIGQCAGAETQHPPTRIADGKDHALPQVVA